MLDPDTCYRALAARDRRFEGRFFVGVRSTGVYCRPGCPAPLPRRRNVSFYACAAAAEEAGFRACLRCRPDTLPGSPAWSGTSATVARALGLIAEGGLDEDGVDGLAARVGVGSRHLRRLFREQLGTSPVTVARTRRAHFARKLIEETELPMTEVALSAGFASLRSFNATMREAFRRTPRELRSRSSRPEPSRSLHLRLPYREPYDWPGLLGYLRDRATAGVEAVQDDRYRRSVTIGGRPGVLEVRRARGAALELTLPPSPARELISVVARVARMFDVAADARRIAGHLKRDPLLRRALGRGPAPRIPVAWSPFELAVRAVLGQQVSVRGATTLAGRLAASFGEPLPAALAVDGVTHLFPTPQALAQGELQGIGLPRARADAIRGLALAVREGRVRLEAGDPAGVIAALTALPGIGAWTAQYVAMRGLGEPDAFPAADLGVRRALASNGTLPAARAVEERAARWRPWRAYAAMALWRADAGG